MKKISKLPTFQKKWATVPIAEFFHQRTRVFLIFNSFFETSTRFSLNMKPLTVSKKLFKIKNTLVRWWKKSPNCPLFKKSGQLCQLHSFFISVLGYFWFLTVFLKPPEVSTYFYFFGKFPQDQQKLGQTCRVSTKGVLATVKTFTLRHFYPWNHFHLGTILTLTYYF